MRGRPLLAAQHVESRWGHKVLYVSVVAARKVERRVVLDFEPNMRGRMELRQFVPGDRTPLSGDFAGGESSAQRGDETQVPERVVAGERRREGVGEGAVLVPPVAKQWARLAVTSKLPCSASPETMRALATMEVSPKPSMAVLLCWM